MHTLHFCNHEIALAEKTPDLKLVCARPTSQDSPGQIDGGKRELREQRCGYIHFPPPRLDLNNASHDQIADLGRVAGAQGVDGK